MFIIAQTIPVIRVMFQSEDASLRSSTSSRAMSTKSKTTKTAMPNEASRPVELVQLPSGRIVAADSEEGRASQSREVSKDTGTRGVQPLPDVTVTSPPQHEAAQRTRRGDEEVHRIWQEMGLSRRAWSKSPSPPPEGARRAG